MCELVKLRQWLRDDETHLIDLTRHFFNRFFDTELISKDAEAHLGVAHILALLAVPGVFYAFLAFGDYSYIYWHFTQARYDAAAITDQCRYLLFSMGVIGLVAVVEWDALFPDARDYAILTPLPLKLQTIFGAKVAALLIFVGLFVFAVAGLPVLFYPMMAVWGLRPDASFPQFARMIAVHAIAVFSGCLFMFLLFVALQGVLINLLSAALFKRVSVYVQGLSAAALVCWFFLLPMVPWVLPHWERSSLPLLFALPPMWFLGLYRVLLGSRDALFVSLARISIAAFVFSVIVAAAAYFACYRRHSQMTLESPDRRNPRGLGIGKVLSRLIERLVLRDGQERATFYFVLLSLARSAKHRLYFTAYVSVGLGLVLIGIVQVQVRATQGSFWAALSRPGEALLSIPLVVSFFMLSGMRIVFAFPTELKANWIFRITDESNGRKCLAGVRKAMIVLAIIPEFALMLTVYSWLWGVLPSVLAITFDVLLSLILMEVLLSSFHKIPFTCSYLPGKANLPALGLIYWLAFGIYAYSTAALEAWMYHEPVAWTIAIAGGAVILQRLAARRNRSLNEGLNIEYEDLPSPAVQSLGLNA